MIRQAEKITDWLEIEIATAFGSEVEVMWLGPADSLGESETVAVYLMTPSSDVRVD